MWDRYSTWGVFGGVSPPRELLSPSPYAKWFSGVYDTGTGPPSQSIEDKQPELQYIKSNTLLLLI